MKQEMVNAPVAGAKALQSKNGVVGSIDFKEIPLAETIKRGHDGDVGANEYLAWYYCNHEMFNDAEKALLRAVDAGSLWSIYCLGRFYEHSRFKHKNIKKANHYFILGAEKGEIRCMYVVALHEWFVKKNLAEASVWLKKIAKADPQKQVWTEIKIEEAGLLKPACLRSKPINF